MRPEVSIIIPTHNRPDLIKRAVVSALAEAPEQAEVIVVDDKSFPLAKKALETILDPRLKVIRSSQVLGAAGARNLGVETAKGQWVFFLDDDDIFAVGYIASVLESLQGINPRSFGFSAITIIESGKPNILKKVQKSTGLMPKDTPIRRKMAGAGAGFWVARQLFIDIGGFDPEYIVDEDTDLCLRLIIQGHQPWYTATPGTIVSRSHSPKNEAGGQLTQQTSEAIAATCYLRTYEKSGPKFSPFSKPRWFLATRYVRRAAHAGEVVALRQFVDSQKPWAFKVGLVLYAHNKIKRARRKQRTA